MWIRSCQYIGGAQNQLHVRADFSADGWMTVSVNGQVLDASTMNPTPAARDAAALASTMRSRGAVLESSQWSVWVPGSCGSGDLGSSKFTISNVRVSGSVVHGPRPRSCSGPSPAPSPFPPPPPSPQPPAASHYGQPPCLSDEIEMAVGGGHVCSKACGPLLKLCPEDMPAGTWSAVGRCILTDESGKGYCGLQCNPLGVGCPSGAKCTSNGGTCFWPSSASSERHEPNITSLFT